MLTPGYYDLQVYNTRRQIELAAGDHLQLLIGRDKNRVVFKRGLLSDEKSHRSGYQKEDDKGDWRATVMQNRVGLYLTESTRPLQMEVAVEDYRNVAPRGGVLRQIRPGLIWFEMLAKDPVLVPSLRVSNRIASSAPYYRLEVPDWVIRTGGANIETDPAVPVLDVYCSTQEPRVAYTFTHEPGQPLKESFRETPPVDGGNLVLKAEFEERLVNPGYGDPAVKKNCLVLRVEHAVGNPVMILPPSELGERLQGSEHHYFRSAGRYTAVFWPVSKAQLEGANFRLRCVSISEFKKGTTAQRSRLLLDNLSPPETR
jgi:hypothetical protein